MSNRKIGMLLGQLHDAETDLAAELREVAQRQSAEHDVFYLCQTLARQCDAHAEEVREFAKKLGHDIAEPDGEGKVANVMSTLRRKTSELIGRQPEAGLLLLRDLRQLYLMAEEANVHWIALGQVAQVLRDHDLLDQASLLQKQTLTQIKWLKTRIKEATPQILCVPQS